MGYQPENPITKQVPKPSSQEITDYRITKVTLSFQESVIEATIEYTYGYMVDGSYVIGGADSATFRDIKSYFTDACLTNLDTRLFDALVGELNIPA